MGFGRPRTEPARYAAKPSAAYPITYPGMGSKRPKSKVAGTSIMSSDPRTNHAMYRTGKATSGEKTSRRRARRLASVNAKASSPAAGNAARITRLESGEAPATAADSASAAQRVQPSASRIGLLGISFATAFRMPDPAFTQPSIFGPAGVL